MYEVESTIAIRKFVFVVITPDDKISLRSFIFSCSARFLMQLADTKYDVEAYGQIFFHARPLPIDRKT